MRSSSSAPSNPNKTGKDKDDYIRKNQANSTGAAEIGRSASQSRSQISIDRPDRAEARQIAEEIGRAKRISESAFR